jgi:uncharacterized protein (TIGR02145 family)
MLKKLITLVFFVIVSPGLYSQSSTIELTFTAVDSAAYLQLDSIKIMNRTQGGETMIYWPDTVLSLEINQGDSLLFVGYATFSTVGIPEKYDDISSFFVNQNYPNPMGDRSDIEICLPHAGEAQMMITDIQGNVVLRTERQLDEGHHYLRFHPGGGNFYILTAYWNGESRSIRMISTGQNDGKALRLDYVGSHSGEPLLKASLQVDDIIVRESGILDSPVENQTYKFQFATNIPCLGTPTVEYEGKVYNTIQIFSQCWLKENLNVGTMIYGIQNQENNGIIEKYCYNDAPDSCAKNGGLYQWHEMMQTTNQQGAQGICPPGWHLPTDEEWKVLEGAVDSQYGIGDQEWDISWGYRGYDAGMNLKSTSGWAFNNNGTDLFGFSGLPGGLRANTDGHFYHLGNKGFWWTSTRIDANDVWLRFLDYSSLEVYLYDNHNQVGQSVRCLRNDY